MKSKKQIIVALTLILTIILSFSSCVNTKRKEQKIIDTFDSFENAQNYVFHTSSPDRLYIRDNVIDLENLYYEGSLCHFVSTTPDCAYFYTYHSDSKNAVDLLSLSYQTLELTFVCTLESENEIKEADYYKGDVYFKEYSNNGKTHKSYLIYNIETKETRNIDSEIISKDIFKNYPSEKYEISIIYNFWGSKLSVKDKLTKEEKIVKNSLIKTCEEGKKIAKLGDFSSTTGAVDCYEYNGEIYIVYIYLVDGFLGYPSCVYVMKYDYDTHTMQYYTSIFMEDYPEGSLSDFKIPNALT